MQSWDYMTSRSMILLTHYVGKETDGRKDGRKQAPMQLFINLI
jgi:hypothetical protein